MVLLHPFFKILELEHGYFMMTFTELFEHSYITISHLIFPYHMYNSIPLNVILAFKTFREYCFVLDINEQSNSDIIKLFKD
ncbi:hypothetical protein AMR72_02410 [Flavobacterium psychrophilum]|nr:hypothetical protein AMR72_02410 [Flavobacterium psychrophilum]AOE51473.1 hypothetical protein ALW18_02410 [Flavobacterium psychrophilum]